MMADMKLLKDAISDSLKSVGFVRKASTWYKENDETILVINLQKSQYGSRYYVNCAIALKSLGVEPFPKERYCHIRFRIEETISEDDRVKIQLILNLEDKTLSDKQRKEEMKRLIENFVLPRLDECSFQDGIAKSIRGGKMNNAMIHWKVMEIIC